MRARAAALTLLIAACSQDPQQVTPPTFERPSRVAFFCFDSANNQLLPLDSCDNRDTGDPVGLSALVTQTARGEVASVDLRRNLVIDTDVRVPGFTFVRVGEVPTAIVIPPENPDTTYIASFGSRWVQWVPTGRFRPDLDDTSAAGAGNVPLPDGPSDMVHTYLGAPEDEAMLYVALPERGTVLPITVLTTGALDGSLSDADEVALELPDPLPTPAMQVGPSEYRHICIDSSEQTAAFRLPTARTTFAPTLDPTTEPKPVDLLIVEDRRELMVADENLPFIHRFSIEDDGSLSPLAPIALDVPVKAIAATPEVPNLVRAETAMERYLYAIDATDGTVMAIDITDPDAETFGAVIPVSVGDERSDRLDLFGKALSLTVMTPGFESGDECDPVTTGEEFVPSELDGVFLAIGLGNGVVQVIDVYDESASCRGVSSESMCAAETIAADRDEEIYLWRHRPRVGGFVQTGFSVSGTVAFAFENTPGILADDGRPRSGEGPGLAQLFEENGDDVTPMCPEFMAGIFPINEPERSVVCAVRDPWAAREERWTAIWGGAIPRTNSGFGRLDSDNTIAARDAAFCTRGVLGEQNIAGQISDGSLIEEDDPDMGIVADPEAQYGGDRLVVTTDPPTDRDGNVEPRCERYVQDEDGVREAEISLPIVRSFNDRVEINTNAPTYEDFVACWDGSLFGFEARVGSAFSVVGSVSGFVHRVIPEAGAGDGECLVDTVGQPLVANDPDTYRNARAFDDALFINPYVAFQLDISPDDEAPTVLNQDTVAQLGFTVANVPNLLGSDIGNRGTTRRRPAIVEALFYSDQDRNLYAVDSNSDGLARISTSPFARERTFE